MPATDTVLCNTCKKEIPRSAAITPEGVNYAMYFCGSGCLARWKEEEHRRRTRDRPQP